MSAQELRNIYTHFDVHNLLDHFEPKKRNKPPDLNDWGRELVRVKDWPDDARQWVYHVSDYLLLLLLLLFLLAHYWQAHGRVSNSYVLAFATGLRVLRSEYLQRRPTGS